MQYAFTTKISDNIIEDNIGQIIATNAILARDGVYEYTSDDVFGDGKFHLIELHRDWEDVKKLMLTLEGKPVIHYHPSKDVDITVDNIDEFIIGHLQNVREGKHEGYNVLIGDIVIFKKEVIPLIKSGKLREISLGYFYNIDDSDPKRLKQVDMVAEHVAMVDNGRAGIARIMDAADEFSLIKLRPGTNNYQVVEYSEKGLRNWRKLKEYGFYNFNPYYLPEQATKIPLQIIGMIVEANPTGVFAVLNDQNQVVRGYFFGKKVDPEYLIENDYIFTEGQITEELDPYDIPDEIGTDTETTSEETIDKELMLSYKLEMLLSAIDRDFRRSGDNTRSSEWNKMVRLMRENKNLIEPVVTTLPEEYDDITYFYIAEDFVRTIRRMNSRKARDNWLSLLVCQFTEDSSQLEVVGSIEEAVKYFKKKVKFYDDLDQFITEANKIDGVFIYNLADYSETQIIVIKPISNEDAEVYICNNLEDLNRSMNEYFRSFEEAVSLLNSDLAKYKKMSAFLV